MRKVPEISFPLSIWPHAIVQALVVVLYIFVIRDWAYWPTMARLDLLAASTDRMFSVYLLVILWLVYVFLLGEMVVRRSQNFAAGMFPHRRLGFHVVTAMVVAVVWYAFFVLLECVLFRLVMGTNPLAIEKLKFYQGFLRTFWADMPLLMIFLVGELLRQWLYRKTLRTWHTAFALHKQNPIVTEDDLN